MIEDTEEPVQIHVGRTLQEVLLQRVLEIVDSFIRILQKANTKEKKAFGLKMKMDLKDSCQTTMKRHSGSSKRTMRS